MTQDTSHFDFFYRQYDKLSEFNFQLPGSKHLNFLAPRDSYLSDYSFPLKRKSFFFCSQIM